MSMDRIKVLIVDDEPRICRGMERLVKSQGSEWEVVAALSNGQQALDYLNECGGAVDLLITDIRMPEMDGLTLITEASKRYAFHAIVLTGFDDFEYVQAALRGGASDYLLKPIDREQIATRLEKMKGRIASARMERYKQSDLVKKEDQLRRTKQTQTLAYITAADTDLSLLGYWVDEFPKGQFLLLYTSLDTVPVKARKFAEKDWKAYFYALDNMISEVAETVMKEIGGSSWVWKGQHSEFWTLLALPLSEEGSIGVQERRSEAEGTAEKIITAVQTFTPFTVSVGCGDWTKDLYLLPMIKRQCLAAVQYRLLAGGNKVFRYGVVSEAEEDRGVKGDSTLPSMFQRIKRSIEQANPSRAERDCRVLLDHIERYTTPVKIKAMAANLIQLIHSTLLEVVGETGSIEPAKQALQAVQEAVNLQELRKIVVNEAMKAAQALADARTRQNVKPVEAAKLWIQENLAGNLTIKRIADSVYMNPTYFCEYFKLQTGETVLDYVTKTRMEMAGKLLTNPVCKLQEVSRAVGYQDVKYFSRLFKQYYGQLPSHYRDSRQHVPGDD